MVTTPRILDEFFTYSDQQLLEKIGELHDAIASPESSSSSWDVGSYSLRSIADMERLVVRMTRCYAARTGAVLAARRGITSRQVVVRKDYFERGTR